MCTTRSTMKGMRRSIDQLCGRFGTFIFAIILKMTKSPTYAFVSLGCPKNSIDSERMLGLLQLDGYEQIHDWFLEVLPKDGIPVGIIDKAILKITPEGKECIIVVQDKEFKEILKFK